MIAARRFVRDTGSKIDLHPFTIRLVDEQNGMWSAFIPQLEGVCGQGRTQESARRNVLSALNDVLSTWADMGWRVPWRDV
jgi:predicted RNase H-like HicB family nuclease